MNPLFEAQDPKTSTERLRELAGHEDVRVRRAVTRHPGAPLELLFALGEVFPAALANNPILVALSRRAPELVRRTPTATVRMLLTVDGLPEPVWAELAQHEGYGVAREVLACPKVPATVLLAAAGRGQPYECATIAANSNAPQALLEQLSRHSEADVRAGVANNASTMPELLMLLARDGNDRVRAAAAGNPHTPGPALQLLSRDECERVWSQAGRNPAVPAAVIERFARSANRWAWLAVLDNPSTPLHVFPSLLRDGDRDVGAALARHPRTPVELLRKLALSESEAVVEAVSGNRNTPMDVIAAIRRRRPDRPLASREGRVRFRLPGDARLVHAGLNFRVYRIEDGGEARCLKIALGTTSVGVCAAQRVVGGVSTVWNLCCSLGSPPRAVGWVSPEAMLESEAARLAAARGTWNHEAIASVACEVDGQVVPGLITQWHDGDLLGALPLAVQRALFPRMLPSMWTALAAARHGDLHPNNIILDPGRERFHLIDPGAMIVQDLGESGACSSVKDLSFVTNAEHYPLIPPYYTPEFSLGRGDSLRGHWEHFKWTFSMSRMAPAMPTILANVMMRAVNPGQGDFIDDHLHRSGEPCPADLLALGSMYFNILTGTGPFPTLKQPVWSRISTVDDRISGVEEAEQALNSGVARPSALRADVTLAEEQLALALLDLQVVSREQLAELARLAAASARIA